MKVNSHGLEPGQLGQSIRELRDHFHKLKSASSSFYICGEGGQYESVVFDCPLFKTKKIRAASLESVVSSADPSSAYATYTGLELVEKTPEEQQASLDALAMLKIARTAETSSHRHLLDENKLEELGWRHKKSIASVDPSLKEYHEGEKLLLDKITLSPSIIDPSLTKEQIKAMPQKD